MGMLGGLAAGFLGAGLFGMLFGGGCFVASAALSSIIGLVLQVGLILIVVRLAMSWWQRRQRRPAAYAMPVRTGRGRRAAADRLRLRTRLRLRNRASPRR